MSASKIVFFDMPSMCMHSNSPVSLIHMGCPLHRKSVLWEIYHTDGVMTTGLSKWLITPLASVSRWGIALYIVGLATMLVLMVPVLPGFPLPTFLHSAFLSAEDVR